jgi:hypothetical protein
MAGLFLNRNRQVPAEDTPAFAGIAERFRRAGDLDRAIALCRDGLRKFPQLLSARVTLGWALLDKGQYDEARTELEQVLRRAPDNLAAIRGLAELHERAESTMPIDAHAAWNHAASEEDPSIDPSVLVAASPAAAPAPPATQPLPVALATPPPPAAASVTVSAAPVAAAGPTTPEPALSLSPLIAAEVPAPIVPAASTLPIIEFTNSAGVPMMPSPDMPAVSEPEPVATLAFDAPLSLEAQPVEEAAAFDAPEEFSLDLPAAHVPVPDLETSSSVFANAVDDIDFGAAMSEPVIDEELPAAAALAQAIELDLPSDLVAQLEAAEDPAPDVLTLPVAAEVNLDALASVFSDDTASGDGALVSDEPSSIFASDVESAVAFEEVPPALVEETEAFASAPLVQEETSPVVVSESAPAIEEPAGLVPEIAAASALGHVPAASSPFSLSDMFQTTLPVEAGPARVDLAGFAVGPAPSEPAAPSAPPASLSEMFAQPAAASHSTLAPVIVSRSPLTELERFLRKVQARRMQIAVGSVA